MGEDEVLVVGAGASGAALAWRLASVGMKVTCLEQGDAVSYDDVPTLGADWELARETTHHPNPNVRRRPEDYPVVDDGSPIKPLMFNGVGGSTVLWGAHVPRFRPSDFRVRSLDGVADDWPVSYEELEPYYDLNDRIVGVAGLAGDPGNPPRPARAMPPVAPGRAAELLGGAFDRLGWHWWVVDAAINTQPYGPGRGICNHCGPCNLGCPQKARASADVTYWPLAVEAGVKLVTRARVFEIETDAFGRAMGVAYYDADGIARRRRAAVVVLAANGIGTPRLLLLSRSERHPDGLANRSGLVGRRLMFHPTAMVTGVFAERVDGHLGPIGASILCQEFYETDPARDFVRGYQMQLLRSYGPLGTATGGFLPPLPWGANHHRRFLDTFGHSASLTVTTEDLPRDENRVTLDASRTDGFGIPAPRIEYGVERNTEAMIAHGIERASEAFREAGATDVVVQPLVAQAGFHLMGTARMGDDPEASVVDRFGQAHDIDNLYVVDGSLFVTAAAVNPTPTIQALALRAADRIVATRREPGRIAA